MTMIWPCKLSAVTHRMDGRKRTINATIEGAGDVAGSVLKHVQKLPCAWEWKGEEVLALTPLGQRVRVLIEY